MRKRNTSKQLSEEHMYYATWRCKCIQNTALIAERLTISSPKPSSEAMAKMQELDLMPKAKSKAKSKVPEQVFSPRVTRSKKNKPFVN